MINQHKTQLSYDVLLQIIDNLPTSVFVKDVDLKFVYANKMYAKLIGKGTEELLGYSDADFYAAEECEGYLFEDRKVINDGESSKREETNARKDGVQTPVLVRKERLEADDGKRYLIGTASDLTAIKKREEQYRALAETVPVGVMQIEEKGEVSFANPLMLAYLGTEVEALSRGVICELFGQNFDQFPGQAGQFETTLQTAIGTSRRIMVICSGWLTLTKGRNRAALISVVDVSENSELKRINEEILRLNQELALNMQKLKDAQDALVKKGRMEQMGQLTATIAHELRNPLGAVRTSTFLIERKLKGKDLGIEAQLQRINNGVIRCDNIITQLLDFSRSKQLTCEAADLDQWLETLVQEEVKRLPELVNVECLLGLGSALVPFDSSRLQRAIVNLISNAAEAMVGTGLNKIFESADEPKITIATSIQNRSARISVKDNGPGIPPELIDKIKEPLFTTKSFGTGLGVPAIEQIAHQHGGQLEIISIVGQGAEFILHLPLDQVKAEAA
jgi:PAS domain S-box-containing protein